MALPPEILEKIFLQCDGKTLLNIRRVCPLWKQIVDYLTEKTWIWKWACDEIPQKELTQYLNNYSTRDKYTWLFIYKNWVTWQNVADIEFEIILSPPEIPRITCIDVSENYIAVGCEDGRVRIFNHLWTLLSTTRHQAEKVCKVTFLSMDSPRPIFKIVISYPKSIIIDDLFGHRFNHFIIDNAVTHSVYKDHICYRKYGGRLTIEKLRGEFAEVGLLQEIWFSRVYSPQNISCINMWDGTCTILISNDVRKVVYNSTANTVPFTCWPERCLVSFSSLPNCLGSQVHTILRDDIIIALSKSDHTSEKQYMEVIILEGGTKYVKKLFLTSEILDGTITCVYLYGNTLVLGIDNGIIYIYHVPSWKLFSIQDYQRKLIIGKHPITNIVAVENKNERKFFVTSSFNIHEVVGFSLLM